MSPSQSNEESQTSQTNVLVVLAWAFLIVVAELISFYLIQQSVDEQSGLNVKVIVSSLLFGIIVTYSFYQILYGGTNIPIANLYWVILSQLGSILIAYYFFNQTIYKKDWIAVILLFFALIIMIYGKTE
jgi:drug/metabolite transporter (DMT)-like permease